MTFPAISSPLVALISDVSEIPDDLELHYEDECFFLRIPLAQSEDERWLVALDVGYQERSETCPCDGINPIDFVMFGFEITLFDQHETVVYQTMDPRNTRAVIPQEIRRVVVDITCECYQRLLTSCDPDYIYRETWLLEPSANALKKHVQATEALLDAGYIVLKEGTDQLGRKFWLLGKHGNDHSSLQSPLLDEQLGVES